MKESLGARIRRVEEDSIASLLGIQPGDVLYRINGRPVLDILDYQFWAPDEELEIEIESASGGRQIFEIEKDAGEDPGLIFDQVLFSPMKKCANRCLFCFIDQLPPGLRHSLYVKDDDYRLSFIYGNFISLTNLGTADWDRIRRLRLSPLYVSVHSMVPEIRAELMGSDRAAGIEEGIQALKAAGVQLHAQIVFCPGLNDGESLEYSLNRLAELYPTVLSAGIVPLGLTNFNPRMDLLRPVRPDEAAALVRLADSFQERFRRELGCGFVYLGDEFYIKAGLDFPPASYYDDYCQLENGIGFCRQLLDEFSALEHELPQRLEPEREYIIVTGVSAAGVLGGIAERLNRIEGLNIQVLPVISQLFGPMVTVAGLLVGKDILNRLGREYAGRRILLPEVALKDDSPVFLDDMSLGELEELTGARFILVDGSAGSLIEAITSDS